MTDRIDTIPFLKMHGAGNDFVVIDNRSGAYLLGEEQRKVLADRHFGIGCDQIVLLEKSGIADVFMRLYNADGGEVGACGNATRCVAWLVMEETGKKAVSVETIAGLLEASAVGKRLVKVNMGVPRFDWTAIPLIEKMDAQQIPFLELGKLHQGFAVNMGNPHVVFVSDDVDKVELLRVGPIVETHDFFPERTNMEVIQVVEKNHLKVRVWERGAGETLACGTGACAAMVAAKLRGLVGDSAIVDLPGGRLEISWKGTSTDTTDSVWMTGPVATSFKGEWAL